MATVPLTRRTIRDGTPVLLRSARSGDIDATLALRAELTRTSRHRLTQPGEAMGSREHLLELTRKLAEAPRGIWLLAFDASACDGNEGDPQIGSVNARPGDRERIAHHCEIGIGNHSSWRGRGLGTLLMEVTLDWAARTPGLEKVCLGVFSGNIGARRLYKRLGFRSEGRSRKHFRIAEGEYQDDIRMGIFVKPGLAPRGYATWTPRHAALNG